MLRAPRHARRRLLDFPEATTWSPRSQSISPFLPRRFIVRHHSPHSRRFLRYCHADATIHARAISHFFSRLQKPSRRRFHRRATTDASRQQLLSTAPLRTMTRVDSQSPLASSWPATTARHARADARTISSQLPRAPLLTITSKRL